MPELIEQMYCSQQIVIPPKFPYILKRYCKAAIKTQPCDLLRWSFEYFKALSQRRPPPVKLRLEYPIYSTEGGLTRGCLKVLANQLSSMVELPIPVVKAAWQGFCLDPVELRRVLCLCEVYQRADTVPFLHFIAVAGGLLTKLLSMVELPIPVVKAAWQGFCLDPVELRRVLCLCEVYQRADTVPFLHFIAVAGGLLTKSLTHTMILLCESLTKEPDGGSAAIPVADFIEMYHFLARTDASKDVKYLNGYREGWVPEPRDEKVEEEVTPSPSTLSPMSVDDYWDADKTELQKIALVDDCIPVAPKISHKLQKPLIGAVSRSPSVERAAEIERENYLKDRKGRPKPDEETEAKLKEMSAHLMPASQSEDVDTKGETEVEDSAEDGICRIVVNDEEGKVVSYDIHGEPKPIVAEEQSATELESEDKTSTHDKENIENYVQSLYEEREDRRKDLQSTFDEINVIVNKFKAAHYDLGMVAGRQMSKTSGEFVMQHIEKEILDYIDDQIAILPDPELKKKKAKPEEIAMIREMLESFVDDNMDMICHEAEEVIEEEETIPEITVVYAVPGIGPVVDEEIIREFEDYALEVSKVQAEVFMPRNIRHFLCPPLEKYVEPIYEDELTDPKKKEEVPTGGALTDLYEERDDRRKDLQSTFDEINAIVNKFKAAHYDLGMVAGRQMSKTSGEFVVQHIEKEILDYIDDQIAILPDPELKKKKAKPEEIAMIREMLESFVDDNMDMICHEAEEVIEEEETIPEITVVYAVPGIGPVVDEEIIREFEDYALEVSKVQAEVFMPRNIRHFLCPPLEKYVEPIYEDELTDPKKKEEVPTGGALTD